MEDIDKVIVNFNSKNKITEITNLDSLANKYKTKPSVLLKYIGVQLNAMSYGERFLEGIHSSSSIMNTCNNFELCFGCRSRNVSYETKGRKILKVCTVCQKSETLYYLVK